jgi:glycosyltransferase involved in cell wall biosynthesis
VRAAPRVRVAYCIDSFGLGGTELNAVRTAEALDRSKFELLVMHLHEDGPLRARYEALGVGLLHFPISNLYSLATAAQGMKLASKIRELEAVVVHTHDLYTNIFATPWARLFTRSKVLASRRWLYEAPRPGLVALNRASYKLAHKVLANSSRVVELLARDENVPVSKIIEIPNFVSDQAFFAADDCERLAKRRSWGVPPDAFLVGTVARLTPVKNHELLLRAAALLAPSIHVLLIGDGPERPELIKLANTLGIQSRVHFAGTVMPTENLHRVLDVSILCSRSEGSPNAVIEALAAARPVIATPVGGVTDIIKHGDNGLLVTVDDVQLLATTISKLYGDRSLMERLGSAGQAHVRSRFHERIAIEKLSSTYLELAAQRK